MSEKKYVVPKEMSIYVAGKVFHQCGKCDFHPQIRIALDAAVRWISENPPVPTSEQAFAIEVSYPVRIHSPSRTKFAEEWIRRMFLAPEDPVPEEVKDLLYASEVRVGCENPIEASQFIEESDRRVLEAYRRGQKAGCK